MTPLPYERYCAEILTQTEELRAVVTSGTPLTTTVPTCPEWTLEDLVRHTGGALRWVEHLVRTRAENNVPDEEIPGFGGPAEHTPEALDQWLAETGDALVRTLREAGPDLKVWTWSWQHDSGFWARRMTHELVVHRADAALTAKADYRLAPEIAADAIDEWLRIVEYVQEIDAKDSAAELRGAGRSIHLHATDAPEGLDAEWLIDFEEEGFTWRRDHAKATVALRGPLTEVLLAFYRRQAPASGGLEVLGDRALLDFWLERASFA
ncbi:maleylpyruvate isomerase family mycothiol-dependent enzyme [Streptomyces sp. NA04227]|uniref:maleylpyruvate isomerase family mycothiol-dependent enzyme n=1 Tax=Streptomyces sp. NA04227 TaxID=2742136 RepID=UPI0015904569|nr:maleylpyruvate isomerase family mycothiol-dependent enzyme [Streptomyces sp. NA04227]QKW09473.1 maleylpyruvate isomerase family mycothiol-dependent enzyme [Streptomyces sp. NA04227]